MELFFRQILALVKKDLTIVVRRRWFGTFIRALAFPIIFTFILSYIKNWTKAPGLLGIGQPAPIRTFANALTATGSTRPKVVIINNGITDGDIGGVVATLTSTIQSSGKELITISDSSQLSSNCPSSNAGVSSCFGAVEFSSSPDHPSSSSQGWNYTMYADGALGASVDVTNDNNDVQIYLLPFQRAIDSAIASTHDGSQLPDVLEYPFTLDDEAEKVQSDEEQYQGLVASFLAFAFFLGFVDITYYSVGYVCAQREQGILQLIDGMLPNRSRWTGIIARIVATHASFDIVYLPGWLVMGAIVSTVAFSNSSPGYFILLYVLTGFALSSYCILVSSLFRKAQLSAISSSVAAMIFAILAQFTAPMYEFGAGTGMLITGLLFPPCAFVYFLVIAATCESQGQAFQISDPLPTFQGSSGIQGWKVPASAFFGCLVFQIVLYPILGAIIEHAMHGTSSKARVVTYNAEREDAAVILESFSKVFKSKTEKKQKVKAVSELSLKIPSGAITVLLGANGSGKTTTLNAIAGLETISSGGVKVDGTGGIGICPQQNISFDDMTVEENVSFFSRLKTSQPMSRAEHKAEVTRLIEGCDLGFKRHARAKKLSGGQKRKLQLAIMFAGGSRVCCIDEASSGIDPLARRKIWEILLKERGQRTILMTTHFLDEAEVLSDYVAIMSSGQLKAEGSVATLKNQLGGGHRVSFDSASASDELLRMSDVKYKSDYQQTIAELLDTTALVSFIAALQRHNVTQYRIHGPTIENVFLGLADEMKASSGLAADLRPGGAADQSGDSSHSRHNGAALDLVTGVGSGPWRQTVILFRKRLTILRHTFMPYFWALAIPLMVSGLVTRFFISFNNPNGLACVNPTQLQGSSYSLSLFPNDLFYGYFVYGPSDSISNHRIQSAIPTDPGYDSSYQPSSDQWAGIPTVNSSSQFFSYVSSHTKDLEFGGLFKDTTNTTMAWSAGYGAQSTQAMLLHSVVNQVLMNKNVTFSFQPFQASFTPADGVTVLVAILTVLGFAIYPCLFALYPTAERLRGVRAMEYSNGILSSSLWLAYLLFDFIFVLIISAVATGIWASQWPGWYALGYMFVVFVLYGLAATAFSYVVSLFASSQLVAMAATLLMQVIIPMLYFAGYVVSAANASPTSVYAWFDDITYTVGLVSPSSNLLRALFMALNDFSLACQGSSRASYPGAINVYGQPILYLTLQLIALVSFLMFWESGRSLEVFGIKSRQKTKEEDPEKSESPNSNPDAAEAAERLAPSNKGLRVSHLSKWFGPTHAVDDVSFGILPSEKFALLGPNGAGKSTVISLIRGELRPSRTPGASTSVHVGGDDIARAPVAAKNHLGVCPQFDATDSMTLREHLEFYARARGVPDIQGNINELLTRLGLHEHADKLASKLSGGTRRKLSLAVALVANPTVLLLDEPSSGMDPAAKRALWRTLAEGSVGRVLLLTTHSMEEADALCDRAGILAGRLLALGRTQDLRDRFGRSITVHLSHRDAPWTSAADVARMREWAATKWPAAQIEASSFGGQLRFSVPRDADDAGHVLMSRLFRDVEAAKDELGVVDYAIGPATLDQVFLNVVGRHDVQEEDMKAKPRQGLMARLRR